MKQIFTLLMFCYSGISIAQNFPIGHRSLTLTDPNRSNRSIDLELYYPAATAGDNQDLASGTFPLVSFGHGFQMTYDAYAPIYDSLAAWGYVVANLETEGSFSPSHTDFGKDLAFVVDYFFAQNTSAGSPFFGKMNGKSAMGGHSMGGGASLLAAQYTTNETCIFNFAAAETNPSAIAQCSTTVSEPLLVIAGSYDLVAPPNTNQEPMYNAALSGCKYFVNLTGGYHCRFSAQSFTCEFGEGVLGPPSDGISRDQQLSMTRAILRPWLDFWLKEIPEAWNQYAAVVNAGQGFSSLSNCSQSLTESEMGRVTIYPNPGKNQLVVETEFASTHIDLLDETGRLVGRYPLNGKRTEILEVNVSPGLYFIKLNGINRPLKWVVGEGK
jgi:hypothetical protein